MFVNSFFHARLVPRLWFMRIDVFSFSFKWNFARQPHVSKIQITNYNLKCLPPQHLVLLIGITPWSFECIIIYILRRFFLSWWLFISTTYTKLDLFIQLNLFLAQKSESSDERSMTLLNMKIEGKGRDASQNDCAVCKQTSGGNSYVNTINFVCHVYNNPTTTELSGTYLSLEV